MNTKNEPGTMVRNYRFRQAAVAVAAMLVSVSLARAGEATSGKEGGPLKVFILAGDENVLEQGMIAPHPNDPRGKDVPGTLMDVIAKQKHFAFLKDEGGEWTVRDSIPTAITT